MKKLLYILTLFLLLFTFLQVSETQAAEDKTAPVVEETKVLTSKVAPGGKVKIQIKVSDDVSGTSRVTLMFYSPSKNATAYFEITVKDFTSLINSYTLETDISKFAELGRWELALITTQDRAGNSKWYHAHYEENAHMKEVAFEVSNDTPLEEVGIEDGFKSLEPKYDVSVNKEFTITFNMNIDISTILENNIYVLDDYGSRVPLIFIIDRGTDLKTSQVIVAPVGSYRVGSAYTLYIKDIVSTSGSKLAYGTKMKFTTKN